MHHPAHTQPNTCYLCGNKKNSLVSGKVRDMPDLKILRCDQCGLVFLENFDHIDSNYYSKQYTNENNSNPNWKQVLQETSLDTVRRKKLIKNLVIGKRYLDIGCEAGGVLLNVKGLCSYACGVEPQEYWRSLLKNNNIDAFQTLHEVPNKSFDIITLFHVLEHIPDPLPLLNEIKKKLAPQGRLFVEVPNADDALLTIYKNKPFSEFTYWSPHLFLYNPHTLKMLIDQTPLNLVKIHQAQRYSLANHLYWLIKSKPNGHQEWSFLDFPPINKLYHSLLSNLGKCDTLIAEIT